ncbi:MAG: hypothetical protein HUU60_00120 [Armatimonadetes bacterium]|nr:hypothetical protein [Armatimonadota bacterium]
MHRAFIAVLALSTPVIGIAQHDTDILFGAGNAIVRVVQPQPHPIRTMSSVQGFFLSDVGMDFYYPDGANQPMLQTCTVRTVYIAPGITGNKSGVGNVFCASGCPNQFVLPFNGTAHHHFIFSTSQRKVYVWDFRAVNARDIGGNPLVDDPQVYRVYFLTPGTARIGGQADPSGHYRGDPYNLWITVQLKNGSTVLHSDSQPINKHAVRDYLVGFDASGTFDVAAKLSKHLSRLAPAQTLGNVETSLNWAFPFLGDVNNDDIIDDADLAAVLASFGTNDSTADLDGDGLVDDVDLAIVLSNFGQAGEAR